MNIVVSIHIPTKLGLAKGIVTNFKKFTSKKPTISTYIKGYEDN